MMFRTGLAAVCSLITSRRRAISGLLNPAVIRVLDKNDTVFNQTCPAVGHSRRLWHDYLVGVPNTTASTARAGVTSLGWAQRLRRSAARGGPEPAAAVVRTLGEMAAMRAR